MINPAASGAERAAAGVLVGGAALFAVLAIGRVGSAGAPGALTLPLVLVAADLLIGAALLTWWYPIRPVAQALAVFGCLVHTLVVLRGGPWWTLGCSAVLAVAHGAALVLLFRLTSPEQDDEADEDDDEDEPAHGRGLAPAGASPFEVVETPVSDIVDGLPGEVEPAGSPEEERDEPGPGGRGASQAQC